MSSENPFDENALVEKLEELFDSNKFKEIWLVGSMATTEKEITNDSDIDVCIVIKSGCEDLEWPEDEKNYPGEAVAEVELPGDNTKRYVDVWQVSDSTGSNMSKQRKRIY